MEFFYFIGNCGAEAWDYSGISVELIEILGRGYIVEHCISLFKKNQEEHAFRKYVADAVHFMNEAVYKRIGGRCHKNTFSDFIDRKPEDNRTGDEIAMEIIKKAGLKVKQ